MYYRCPVCNMVIKGNRNIELHLTDHNKLSSKREEYLGSYILVKEGLVNSKGRTGTSVSEPLMQLIEKECAITE